MDAKRAAVYERLISMATDGKHGDALTREEAKWVIENNAIYNDEELSQMIGTAAVNPFRQICKKIGF